MHIYSVNDPEFKSYGNVWDDVPSELTSPVLEALSATPIPEGSKYVASAPELEGVKDADKLGFLMFGGRPSSSAGATATTHASTAWSITAPASLTWAPATLSCSWRIAGRSRTASSTPRASRRSACRRGTVVEVFNTTLHYTPCMVDDGGFQVMVALPAGTNGPRPEAAADVPAVGDSYCYWKADKWVLCHADSPKAAEGGYVSLFGKNLDIACD